MASLEDMRSAMSKAQIKSVAEAPLCTVCASMTGVVGDAGPVSGVLVS